MPGTERKSEQVVQLRLGQRVIVEAVLPIPQVAQGGREDQRPALEELERYINVHWPQICNLPGGKFEDSTDLASERDTDDLVGILNQFGVGRNGVFDRTKKKLIRHGASPEDAGMYANELADFLLKQNLAEK